MDPDGDSIGSQLALAEFIKSIRKKFRIINHGKLPTKYLFLDRKKMIENDKTESYSNFKPDLSLVLECPSLERTGWVRNLIVPGCKVINIDHHQDNTKFGDIVYIDLKASAVGEIIYDFLTATKFHITKPTANWLYAAILTDTGRFRFSSTSSKTLRICADLIDKGADPNHLTNEIYFNFSPENMRLLGHVLKNLRLYEDGKISCLLLDKKTLAGFDTKFEDTEGLVDYSLYLGGVEVGVLFKEIAPYRTKVSLRSQNHLDISQVAKVFGGGGHKNAAGCTVEQNLMEAQKKVLERIKKIFNYG